eukprot:6121577-Pleurochrysis_carterae.AAC.2
MHLAETTMILVDHAIWMHFAACRQASWPMLNAVYVVSRCPQKPIVELSRPVALLCHPHKSKLL